MKKLFYYMAVVAVTLTFTACGSKGPKFETGDAPDSVKKVALMIHSAFQEEPEEGLTYEGIEVINKDIIATITMDESQMHGMTMTQAMRANGISPSDFQNNIKNGMISSIKSDPESALLLPAFQSCGYDIVIRIQGSASKETLDVVLEHDLWNDPYLY